MHALCWQKNKNKTAPKRTRHDRDDKKKNKTKQKQKQFLSIGFFFSINLHCTKAILNNKKFKATKKAEFESVKRHAKRQNKITQTNWLIVY